MRVFDLFDDSASFDEYEHQDSETGGYYRYRVEPKKRRYLRLWLPYYQVERKRPYGVIPSDRLCADISRRGVRDYTFIRICVSRPVAAMARARSPWQKLDFPRNASAISADGCSNLGQNINILSESLSETPDELQDKTKN